eukprot:TRINITY_DN89564_c0_g1_i1.p1 TRINITY_DN89564_c0_g1~~TRINITY_DN89564_c0_g1_i1.p1  ORF type:complete len:1514 (+),score=293.40 TRINITY_DN89564_c0_g1_i1:171-4544(+)
MMTGLMLAGFLLCGYVYSHSATSDVASTVNMDETCLTYKLVPCRIEPCTPSPVGCKASQPAGAWEGDATPFSNIGLVTFGYNSFSADIQPPTDPNFDIMLDPGLRRPVFALEYKHGSLSGDRRHTQPDGYHATVDVGCSNIFSSKVIESENDYTSETKAETSLTLAGEVKAGFMWPEESLELGDAKVQNENYVTLGLSGTLSYTTQHKHTEKTLEEWTMIRSVARCSSYVAAIDYRQGPTPHPDFQAAVDTLPADAEKYWDLFDEFGTHFLTQVKMGARHSVSRYLRKQTYDKLVTKVEGLGVSLKFALDGTLNENTLAIGKAKTGKGTKRGALVSSQTDFVVPEEITVAAEALEDSTDEYSESSVGAKIPNSGSADWLTKVQASPVPIKFDRREICLHPSFGKKAGACWKHLGGYCEGRLKAKGVSCQATAKDECISNLDCKDGFACVRRACKAIPVCQVTLCSIGVERCGESYTLPEVTTYSDENGKIFDLTNGGWADKISAVRLSDGCKKVELVDDDGECNFGKPDNGLITESTVFFPFSDLDKDVCKIKVWAKEPSVHNNRRLESAGQNGTAAVEAKEEGLAEINVLQSSKTHTLSALRGAAHSGAYGDDGSTAGSSARGHISFPPRLVDFAVARTGNKTVAALAAKLVRPSHVKTSSTAGEGHQHASRRMASVDKDEYIKNCGKAMYGYNHYFGAPLSAHNAGTDPGFTHRPLWEDEYKLGKFAAFQDFTQVPKRMSVAFAVDVQLDVDGSMRKLKPGSGYDASVFMPKRDTIKVRSLQTNKHVRVGMTSDPEDGVAFGKGAWFGLFPGGRLYLPGKEHASTYSTDDTLEMKATGNSFLLYKNGEKLHAWENKASSSIGAKIWFYEHWGGVREVPAETHWATNVALDYAGRMIKTKKGNAYDAFAVLTNRQIFTVKSLQTNRHVRVGLTSDATDSTDYARGAYVGLFPNGRLYSPGADHLSQYLYSSTDRLEIKAADGHIYLSLNDHAIYAWHFKARDTMHAKIWFYEEGAGVEEVPTVAPEADTPGRRLNGHLKVPDGWRAQVGKSAYCEAFSKTKTIQSPFQYQRAAEDILTDGWLTTLDVGDHYSFSYSEEAKEFSEANGDRKKLMVMSSAECVAYVLEMEDLENAPPPSSDSFKVVADSAITELEFYLLFDLFGLQFPTRVVFGARYGFTQYISEISYSSLKTYAEKAFGSATAYQEVDSGLFKDEPFKISGKLSLTLARNDSSSDKQSTSVSQFFEQRKEFSVGKRLPENGDMDEWTKDVISEPMPIKVSLKSICEHPVFKGARKRDCLKFAATYCNKHLRKLRPDISCAPLQDPECVWDLQCPHRHVCNEGICVPEPSCSVTAFKDDKFKGASKTYGPVYYQEGKDGEVIDLGGAMDDDISSFKISGGCAEVVLMDEDNCMETHEDNLVIDNRLTNTEKARERLPWDLNDDVCKMKLIAKKSWVKY